MVSTLRLASARERDAAGRGHSRVLGLAKGGLRKGGKRASSCGMGGERQGAATGSSSPRPPRRETVRHTAPPHPLSARLRFAVNHMKQLKRD